MKIHFIGGLSIYAHEVIVGMQSEDDAIRPYTNAIGTIGHLELCTVLSANLPMRISYNVI